MEGSSPRTINSVDAYIAVSFRRRLSTQTPPRGLPLSSRSGFGQSKTAQPCPPQYRGHTMTWKRHCTDHILANTIPLNESFKRLTSTRIFITHKFACTYVCRIKECGTIVYSDDYILEFKGCQIKEYKDVYGHIASSLGDNMTATRMQIAQGEYQPGEKKPSKQRLSGTSDMQSLQASATDPGGFIPHDHARSHRLRPQRLTSE